LPAETALLEREAELSALHAAIAEAGAGQARVVVVEGAGGIGKTRLLAEARRVAEQAGHRVLKGRGGELEREFAFGVVRQLFEPAVVGAEESLLTGAATATREVFALAGPTVALDPGDRSFALLHGLYWLTVNLAGDGPLAFFVDDLHLSDVASLRFLAYLVRRLEGLPVLIIGTARPVARTDLPALQEVTRDPLSLCVRPRPLSVDATASLVVERLGDGADGAFAGACHQATAGNPLLLHELLETLALEGVKPDAAHVTEVAELGAAASRAVLARLARLSPGDIGLARAAAVLGEDAELSTVAALAGVELEQAGAGVAELARMEVLDAGPSLGFVHPLVGAAVYRDMSGPERALWHERAAGLLADRGADPERVAAHLLLSPARANERVVGVLIAAARSSVRNGAADSAVAYLKRALREPPPPNRRAEVLLELGRAEALTHGLSAVEHLSQAYELLEDLDSRAVAAHALSKVLLLTGEPGKGARLARAAASELPPDMEDARRQLEALELIALLIGGGADDALARLERYRQTPVGPGLGAKMLAAMAAEAWASSGGASDVCAELALGALVGGELMSADTGLFAAGSIEIVALADREEALDASQRALAEAHRAGSVCDVISAGLWRGFVLYWRGELADADQALASISGEEAGLWGLGGPALVYGHAMLSAVLRERGELSESRRALEQSSDRGDDGEAARYWMQSQLELLVAEGRMREAMAVSDEFQTRFAHARDAVNTPWRSPTVLALHRLGHEDEAVALAREDLESAQRWGAPGTVARALRVLGTLEGEAGHDALEQAVRITARTPAKLQHTKALAALGAAMRRARHRADARKPLRQALALAEVLGADSLAGQVRSELRAAGARPRTTALRGVAALTPSERRVATLAAIGHTNREIAQQLFVTPKTVEMHLSRAYYKLEVGSRSELRAHAAELQSGDESG